MSDPTTSLTPIEALRVTLIAYMQGANPAVRLELLAQSVDNDLATLRESRPDFDSLAVPMRKIADAIVPMLGRCRLVEYVELLYVGVKFSVFMDGLRKRPADFDITAAEEQREKVRVQ